MFWVKVGHVAVGVYESRKLNLISAQPYEVIRWAEDFKLAIKQAKEQIHDLRTVLREYPYFFASRSDGSQVTQIVKLACALAEAHEFAVAFRMLAVKTSTALDGLNGFMESPIHVEFNSAAAETCVDAIATDFVALLSDRPKTNLPAPSIANEIKTDVRESIGAAMAARPYEIEALASYAEAVKAKSELSCASFKTAWEWIKENGVEIDGEQYTLPKFSTWSTYVRKAKRKAIEQQSRDPRG
jgi:hypothetical protein